MRKWGIFEEVLPSLYYRLRPDAADDILNSPEAESASWPMV